MDVSSSDGPVHQLWPPPEGNQRTELDVVLFHGLQLTTKDSGDAWSSTWTQRGRDDVCWPREWLPYDLGEAVRIFSVSYNADVVASPHGHVSDIAHNLFQTLMTPRYEWHNPIVLIGHSFGGLVLKSLVVKLKRASTIRNRTNSWCRVQLQCVNVFLSNVMGVAFYAVPHAGSTNIPKYVNKLLKRNNRHKPGIMGNIQPRQRDMEQLSVDFGRIVNENKINVYAFCEGRPTEQVGILVDETSARRSAADDFYMIEDADHMEVCKPPSKKHPSYELLLQFIVTCKTVVRSCDQPLQEVHDLPQSMFGLESYVGTVETSVTSGGSESDPQYVGVFGMGGVGKTLLLKRVCGSPRVKAHFQEAMFIWLTVGQNPDINRLYLTLSKKLDLDPELYVNPEDYKRYLHTEFIQKRVFLILDDIWEEQTLESLDLAKGEGSVTLLSTRNQSLFERANPCISQVHMIPLEKEDSWSLFCVHAFKPPTNVPDELEEFARSMAQECQGLPLALKVVGGAMFGKYPCEWESQLRKLTKSRMHEGPIEQLYERLKVGYDLLSARLKQCFHYFAAFPEDSVIFFEEILFHWTAEGLVPGHYENDPKADAFSFLKTLCEKSFIESNGQFGSDQCYMLNFKVHDVMRDLAFYLLEKDCGTPSAKEFYRYRAGQNLEKIPEEWKAISEPPESECTTILEALRLSLDTNKFKILPKFYAPKLVFLLLGRNPIVSLPTDFSSYFPKLSVLNLRNGQFHSLPDELGDLKNLTCLDLSNCHDLEILPDTVRKCRKLKFLILDDCWGLKYLPCGMVDLTSLQVLHTAHCGCLTWAEHTLARGESGNLYPTVGASLEDICRLLLLTELTVFADEDWHPALKLFNLPQNELPHNISSLTKLKLLQLSLDIKTLPDGMSCRCIQLQELELCSSILKYLPRSFTHRGAFPALIRLNLSCYNLVEFPEVDEGALPKLKTLDFTGCECPSVPDSLNFLTSLRKIIVVDIEWYVSEMSSTWEQRDVIKGSWQNPVSNRREYTFGSYHSLENISMYLQWKRANIQRRTGDFELENLT